MTNQHPLTDEICDQIQDSIHPCDPENMRAVADWQLQQVFEWIESELGRNCYLNPSGYYDHEVDVEYVLEELKEAMRPSTEENNDDQTNHT